jgi:hypothetical protein
VAEYLPSGQIDSPTDLSEYYLGNLPFLWRRIKRPEPWQPWLTWQAFDSKTITLPGWVSGILAAEIFGNGPEFVPYLCLGEVTDGI